MVNRWVCPSRLVLSMETHSEVTALLDYGEFSSLCARKRGGE